MNGSKNLSLKSIAVIYARVSSKDQEKEGFSIPAQLKLLGKYAMDNGFSVVEEYVDVETAKQTGRQNFTAMVNFLKKEAQTKPKDKCCRVLLVEKTDRLYRNLKDWVVMDELAGTALFFFPWGFRLPRSTTEPLARDRSMG